MPIEKASDKERRQWRRFAVACPAVITDARGQELLRTRTANISDGGALLADASAAAAEIPADPAVPIGQKVHLHLRLPRQTPNTFMYEEFTTAAAVVRHHRPEGAEGPAVAVKFEAAADLQLEE